jgi:hypothetical protein
VIIAAAIPIAPTGPRPLCAGANASP